MSTNIFNIIAKPGSSASTATPTAVFQIIRPPERDASGARYLSRERGCPAAQHLLSPLALVSYASHSWDEISRKGMQTACVPLSEIS